MSIGNNTEKHAAIHTYVNSWVVFLVLYTCAIMSCLRTQEYTVKCQSARGVMEKGNLTKLPIPRWKTKRFCFAALLAAVSVVISTLSAVIMSFSTTAADPFFTCIERCPTTRMAGKETVQHQPVQGTGIAGTSSPRVVLSPFFFCNPSAVVQ